MKFLIFADSFCRIECITGQSSSAWSGEVTVVRKDHNIGNMSGVPVRGHNRQVVFSYLVRFTLRNVVDHLLMF